MKLRTEVEIPAFPFKINHAQKLMLMGSCFTQNIGDRLNNLGFETLQNPYGITFNPLSIAQQLIEILEGRIYTESDLRFQDKKFLSFQHHSEFNEFSEQEILLKINNRISEAEKILKEADVLFLSLGSSWTWKKSGAIVNNCHKVPSSEFDKVILSADEITTELSAALELLKQFNPKVKIVFTVSPIRHWRHGAIENMRSKANLLVAVHELIGNFTQAYYFPSFELMLDDLRDYRFYTEDMLHPTKLAIDYIWEKFGHSFFDAQTMEANKLIVNIKAMQNHRPINPTEDDLKKFESKLNKRLSSLKKQFEITI